MMVLLGFQLKNVQWSGRAVPLALAGSMRMLVGPAIALGFSLLLGLQGPARQAGILEAAMPAAVLNTVVATVYDAEPSFVTAVVFMTTLLSPLTLTPLLAYLGA
jgi:predicted permease